MRRKMCKSSLEIRVTVASMPAACCQAQGTAQHLPAAKKRPPHWSMDKHRAWKTSFHSHLIICWFDFSVYFLQMLESRVKDSGGQVRW